MKILESICECLEKENPARILIEITVKILAFILRYEDKWCEMI